LAERRLANLKAKIGDLVITDEANASFGQLARHWLQVNKHSLSGSTAKRKQLYVEAMEPFLNGIAIRNVRPIHCEKWVLERGVDLSASTFNHELETMRSVFEYALKRGLILNNPAADISRKKVGKPEINVPTREQFGKLIETIRYSDGRAGSQAKAKDGADLVELLAYSGCRLGEARALRWKHANFEKNRLTVPGTKSENSSRVIPMSTAMRDLLLRLRKENPTAGLDDCIVKHKSARKCLETACRKLGYPTFYHHAMRHYFATCCIESGVDIPTVSRWLGHKDGGPLAMKVYSHLRAPHSDAMIAQVSFDEVTTAKILTVQAVA